MATRIDLPKDLVAAAFTQRTQSLQRAANAATNNLVKTALQDELRQLQSALATITEVK